MRTLRFHRYGEPTDVLRLEDAEIPEPHAGQVRVRVEGCGLNPADWALCRGLFPGDLPRGVGLDVSGTVDAVGEGVTDTQVGDRVFGATEFAAYSSAGAAEFAVLRFWAPAPEGLDMIHAASLPMAVETASRSLDALGVAAGQTVMIYGAGTMMGFAAVQIAQLRGAKVVAAAGSTFAGDLRALGAEVTPYGEGMVERVRAIAGGEPDLIYDAGPISDVLPELLRLVGGDGQRIVTVSNHFNGADALGVKNSSGAMRWDAFAEFGRLAAEGRFRIPVARTYRLDEWRAAVDASLSGHAHGKLVLSPG